MNSNEIAFKAKDLTLKDKDLSSWTKIKDVWLGRHLSCNKDSTLQHWQYSVTHPYVWLFIDRIILIKIKHLGCSIHWSRVFCELPHKQKLQ